MRHTFQIWAPPGRIWSPEIRMEAASAVGVVSFQLSCKSISNAPSAFELEVTYWRGNQLMHDIVIGPGDHSFTMDCVCVTKLRARSYSIGQIIEVNIDG